MNFRVLDPHEMTDADWPADHARLRGYVAGFAREGVQALIANVQTRVAVLANGEHAFPVTLNVSEYENAFVCSPYVTYARYAKEEMRLLKSKALRWGLGHVADATGTLLKRARIDQMAQVNNWLLSTNLFPCGRPLAVPEMTAAMMQHAPESFICFRSINAWDNGPLLVRFRDAGYQLIASRQVYVFDELEKTWLSRSNGPNDRRLLRQTKYRVVLGSELDDLDFKRMAELYAQLYLQKYSQHNPRFTSAYLRLCHQTGTMTFRGLRGPDGRLDGVLGLFIVDGTVTAPIVGYDTAREQKLGLYRLLMTLVFEFALERGYRINLSSGAANFKRLRGGRPFIEYSAIYARHLDRSRRLALSALAAPVNAIGIPLMRTLKL